MGMSVAGIVFDGYFFAFHLLNIVNNNQLLRGVIQAVTQNGQFYVASSRRIVRSVITRVFQKEPFSISCKLRLFYVVRFKGINYKQPFSLI